MVLHGCEETSLASLSERSDDKTRAVAQVFEAILLRHVEHFKVNVDLFSFEIAAIFEGRVVDCFVEARHIELDLNLPLELVLVFDLVGDQIFDNVPEVHMTDEEGNGRKPLWNWQLRPDHLCERND